MDDEEPDEKPDPHTEYRAMLLKLDQESQTSFDKTLLTLSGGALVVSAALTKDVIGASNVVHAFLLMIAWGCWASSSAFVLASFLTSQRALRSTILELDRQHLEPEATSDAAERPACEPKKMRLGGVCDWLTENLNIAGLATFLMGLISMVFFLSFNIRDKMGAADPASGGGGTVFMVPPASEVIIRTGQVQSITPIGSTIPPTKTGPLSSPKP